ncbi:LysR family transcriptional regulator [Snodgrassella alvi]|uniref:helix-turn-helix domain-containing protein n=1 Tax=Snodgrassella alvi TaxID=1196083 RepID=UPI0029E12E63|nr:LysR family transcriptional regulator [Snodgrassella alvi]
MNNEAAKNLNITQPSLSTAVNELEAEFGIEIFVRTSKRVSLSTDVVEFWGMPKTIKPRINNIDIKSPSTQKH